ncbi:ABC transporter-like protein [Morchella snyderi]|nr:ABC transporter-like protein [Morchella snyderi]
MAEATANSTCLSGGVGVVLAQSDNCGLGFYCPNNTATHPPEYCPPKPECQIIRMGGEVCEPQGLYEPIVCPRGNYCPKGGKEMIKCPPGHWCPVGSFEPWRCKAGTICREGSSNKRPVMGFGISVAIDMILIITLFGAGAWKRMLGRDVGRKRATKQICNESELSMQSAKQVTKDPEFSMSETTVGKTTLPGPEIETSQIVDEVEELMEETNEELKKLVESFGKCIDGNHFGLSFDFRELGLTLQNGRQLLADVNGSIERGSMWGVMGPSGAGKTTFMNVLMGKIDKTSGSIFVNGVKEDMKVYKRIIGYVPQDDIVLAELTVRQNILHSARVRLPSNWSESMIQDHVDRIISCLSLTHVQHTLVGDAIHPVISGGQRKRVNIGIELAAAPMALFCDEPTSGLDSTAALQVVKLLQAISKLGVTVVSVIHQPRTEIFECLDNILLIAEGRPLWQGGRVDMITYFKSHGFNFKPTFNPADIVMDVISGQGHRHRSLPRENEIQYLISKWQISKSSKPLPTTNTTEESNALVKTIEKRGAHWYKQVWYCFVRSLIQQRRQFSGFALEIFVGGVAGAAMGLATMRDKGHLFHGIYRNPNELLSSALLYIKVPQIGMLMCMAIGIAGGPGGVKVFGEEKQIYWRETASGHSRSAYYVGKVLSTFFRISFSALHFVSLYSLLGTPSMDFGHNYLCCMMYFYCIYGLASCMSMITRRENGPLVSVISGLVTGIISGYGPTLADVKTWHLEWFWRISPATWFVEAYFTENVYMFSYLYDVEHAARTTGYTLNEYVMDIGMMFVIGTLYRVIAYVGLICLRRDKQR